jgi:D-arabinan endo alpha-(1,5)-arabinofuranosidase
VSAAHSALFERSSLLVASLLVPQILWLGAARADPPAPAPEPILQPLAPGQVLRIGPTAGTGTPTRDFNIGATDLCDFMEFPTEVLQICGDSFPGQGVGFGRDFAPIALRVETSSVDDPAGVRYSGVMGVPDPLLADPTPPGDSQLPAGVVRINRRNYLMVTTTNDLIPQSSRLVAAEPARAGWRTVPGSRRDASFQGGSQTQISGYYDPIPTADSPTGWVYIVANNFTRRNPVMLYRATPQTFTDRSRWQGWASGAGGGWGKPPTALWPDMVGEMCIRQIDGKAVLSYFNASTGNMEVRVANDPTSLGEAPVTTVVQHDEWPDPAESLPPPYDNRLAQPYGGYISPGSTLDELRIFVSQWDTRARVSAPYRVIQFAVNPFRPE